MTYSVEWQIHGGRVLALLHEGVELFWAVHPAQWWYCAQEMYQYLHPGLDCMEFA